MPMDFPDMESLVWAAKAHKFRECAEGETEAEYRIALANHVHPIDFIESMEIRKGAGWDKWTDTDGVELLMRAVARVRG